VFYSIALLNVNHVSADVNTPQPVLVNASMYANVAQQGGDQTSLMAEIK